MTQDTLPLLIEPDKLAVQINRQDVLIVDLSDAPLYHQQHVPGAVHLEYARLLASRPPVMGLLPAEAALAEALSALGLTPDTHVIAYDNETNNRACRFLWTLDVIGHRHFSLLNGGLNAWLGENHPVDNLIPTRPSTNLPVHYDDEHRADKAYILDHLDDPEILILDTRSAAEYAGTDRRAQRAGHIPHAINIEWTQAIDRQNNMKFKNAEQLQALYRDVGITADKEVIVHCQTHQRSSHSYIVLKSLGYSRLKGYPGSWSEWGNAPDTPIE